MQSKPKTNSVITSRIPDGAEMIEAIVRFPARMVFETRNADGTLFAECELDLTKIHADNLGRAIVHGLNQRVPDAAAIGLTDKDGDIIPRGERTRIKSERMNDLCTFYESGTADWSRVGTGTGSSKSLTIEAIARAKDWTYARAESMAEEHAKIHFAGDRAKALVDIRAKSPKTRAAMDAIRAERLAAKATIVGDGDEMLDAMPE